MNNKKQSESQGGDCSNGTAASTKNHQHIGVFAGSDNAGCTIFSCWSTVVSCRMEPNQYRPRGL
jgi:hypothetical protein